MKAPTLIRVGTVAAVHFGAVVVPLKKKLAIAWQY
jgi:hypothetical protein